MVTGAASATDVVKLLARRKSAKEKSAVLGRKSA